MTVRPRLLILVVALVTLLAYLPARHHGFVVYDDPDYLTENRMVQAGLTSRSVVWAFTTWHASNWHPVTWLSHELDCELFGLDAGAHHLVSAVIHATNAALFLLVLFRMTRALWASALAAALFAWHPLRVESVAWAAERKDVLCGLFWMLALWAYAACVEHRAQPATPGANASGRPGRAGFYFLALGFFAAGLLSKPMMVTLPFVLLLLDYWPLGTGTPEARLPQPARAKQGADAGGPTRRLALRAIADKWPFLLLSAGSCIVTLLAQRSEAMVGLEPFPFGVRLANAVAAYAGYLLKTIWPVDLAVLYPLHPPAWTDVALAGVVLAGISGVAWRFRRERPHLLVGWLWFLGTLVPVIGLVQVGRQAMADRYTYIPTLGLSISVAFEARYWLGRLSGWSRRLASVLAGLALAACLGLTVHQLGYWASSQKLLTHALAVTRDNPVTHNNLGIALEEAGQAEEARQEYEQAVALDPGLAEAQNNLGRLCAALGRSDEALEHYREGLRLKPRAPLLHDNLGTLLAKLGRFDEALQAYATAARLDPTDPRPHFLAAKVRLQQGLTTEAIAEFRQALRLAPDDVQALVYLARILAASARPGDRNGAEAVSLAERANELTGGAQPFVVDTLAMAYAESLRFDAAQEAGRKAIELAAAAGETNAVTEMQRRLQRYQSGQPWREEVTPRWGTSPGP